VPQYRGAPVTAGSSVRRRVRRDNRTGGPARAAAEQGSQPSEAGEPLTRRELGDDPRALRRTMKLLLVGLDECEGEMRAHRGLLLVVRLALCAPDVSGKVRPLETGYYVI